MTNDQVRHLELTHDDAGYLVKSIWMDLLPDDAFVHALTYNTNRATFMVCMCSKEFEVIKNLDLIPKEALPIGV